MNRSRDLITPVVLSVLLSLGLPSLARADVAVTVDPLAAEVSKSNKPEISRAVTRAIARDSDAFLRRVDRIFEQQGSGGVITREVLADQLQLKRARGRASRMAQFLTMDVDGDGALTVSDKAVLFRLGPGGTGYQRLLEQISAEADANSDDVVSFGELIGYANRQMEGTISRTIDRDPYDLRRFDRDGDGNVRKEEVVAAVEEIRAAPSVTIGSEASGHPTQRPTVTTRPSQADCLAPIPPDGIETVILSGYGGAAVSTAAVAGLDRETSVATVSIEEGDKALYILANAYEPVIWKLDGAVDRIANFVIQSGRPNGVDNDAAVVGLDEKVVTFVPKNSCVPGFTSVQHGGATLAKARMAAHFGRPVDHVIAHPALAGIRLPSGEQDPKMKIERQGMLVVSAGRTFELTATGCRLLRGSDLETRFERQYPGGVIKVHPTEAVAAGPVEMYDVLPGPAGVLQLMHLGAISRTRDGYFLIKKQIPRFPAGFGGEKFILADGVPVPPGAARQRSVIRQSTGECVPEARCEQD